MALNMKTLGTRALTALVFVIVLLGCLLWNYYSFSIFFFIVSMIGLGEFFKISEHLGAKPFRGIGFVAGAFLYLSFVNPIIVLPYIFPTTYYFTSDAVYTFEYFAIIIPFVILAFAMFSRNLQPLPDALYTIGGLIYAVLPFALLNKIVFNSLGGVGLSTFNPPVILGCILLIWSNDTFAYLGGSLLGRHKMIERISPGKTWEGTIFGMFMTLLSGYIVGHYILKSNLPLWLILGAIIPVLATIGDLIESMLKRQAGLKDSGTLMPGHGGVLDRFDSLIFVTPFVYVILKLLNA